MPLLFQVSQLKLETAQMMQEYLALRLDEEKHMRTLVEEIMQGHQNAQEAKVKLKEYKRKIGARKISPLLFRPPIHTRVAHLELFFCRPEGIARLL